MAHESRWLFAFFVAAALFPNGALAQVVITEIMYDLESGADGGREWVEVFNTGTTPIALKTWRVFENGTAHKITPVSGEEMLPPGAYAVIADNAAKFRSDWPHYGGQLFDSAFSLSNSGETIVLRNASSTDIDTATYQNIEAAGDGNSLNRTSSGAPFISRSPSPGSAISVSALAPPPKEAAPNTAQKPKKSVAEDPVAAPTPMKIYSDEMQPESAAPALPETSPYVASVAASGGSWVWWLGAVALAIVAFGALFIARRVAKDEWDIIEETPETR